MSNNQQNIISVIITSYTMERYDDILEVLASLKCQTYKFLDIIIVVEKSRELCNKLHEDLHDSHNIKVLFNIDNPGISSARNLGIQHSIGSIIAFVDDDAILSSKWADETNKTYIDKSDIVGLTGPIVPIWEDENMSWFPKEFYWIFACTYYDWDEYHEVRNGYGTNISFRREVFSSIGLFKTDFGSNRGAKKGTQTTTAEETELSLRIREVTGKSIIYNPKIIVHHKVQKFRLSTKYLWKRSYIEGFSKALLQRKYHDKLEGRYVLQSENDLLNRIIFGLYPTLFKEALRKPSLAIKKFFITSMILLAVATGYIFGNMKKQIRNEVQI